MTLSPAMTNPRSVAVVGASDDPAKWGYWLATGALEGVSERDVWLVNHRQSQVLGNRAYASVADLPAAPDLLALAVPAGQLCDIVEEALGRGTRAFLAVTAGLEATAQERLVVMLDRHDAAMVGPNSLGMFDAGASLSLAWGRFRAGSLAIVSQSGQLGLEIAGLAAASGIGISRFFSVGNQVSVTAADVLESLVDHDATEVVALYLEGFPDGRRVIDAIAALRRAGKRTLVLTTGATEGSQRLARSHTGSMTSALDVVDAACRAAGALRVATPQELVDAAAFLRTSVAPAGTRIGVVSDSGGQGGIAADVAAAVGLVVPRLSDDLQRRLAELLPDGAATANPIDLAGAGEADLDIYHRITAALSASGEVDAVLLSGYLGCYGADTPALLGRELDVVRRIGKEATSVPVIVHTMSRGGEAVEEMAVCGLPAYVDVAAALGATAAAARLDAHPGRPAPDHARVLPPAAPCAPVAGAGYWAARDVLTRIGVASPRAVLVRSRADLAAAATLTPPLVLKADWLEHKSEHGGVQIGLADPDDLASAYDAMRARLGEGAYVVEEQDQRGDVVEMIVGGRRDRDFGPTVTVGLGGVEAELWRDTCVELAPVDRATAHRMIASLTSKALLDGWRGRAPVDVEALADVAVALSQYLVDTDVEEIEINPLRVAPTGALAVDALIVSPSPVAPATP